MYRDIELYDIKNRPPTVYLDLQANAISLSNDLYICVEGNHMELPQYTKDALISLAKRIEKYFGNSLDK